MFNPILRSGYIILLADGSDEMSYGFRAVALFLCFALIVYEYIIRWNNSL